VQVGQSGAYSRTERSRSPLCYELSSTVEVNNLSYVEGHVVTCGQMGGGEEHNVMLA
jgi:hypothetical protein